MNVALRKTNRRRSRKANRSRRLGVESLETRKLLNGDPVVTVTPVAFAEEGHAVEFEVRLDRQSDGPVVVHYHTQNVSAEGTQVEGVGDYQATDRRNSLAFAPGETSKTISIETFDDKIVEETEQFFLVIDIVRGGAAQYGYAIGNILDNDGPHDPDVEAIREAAAVLADPQALEEFFGLESPVPHPEKVKEAEQVLADPEHVKEFFGLDDGEPEPSGDANEPTEEQIKEAEQVLADPDFIEEFFGSGDNEEENENDDKNDSEGDQTRRLDLDDQGSLPTSQPDDYLFSTRSFPHSSGGAPGTIELEYQGRVFVLQDNLFTS